MRRRRRRGGSTAAVRDEGPGTAAASVPAVFEMMTNWSAGTRGKLLDLVTLRLMCSCRRLLTRWVTMSLERGTDTPGGPLWCRLPSAVVSQRCPLRAPPTAAVAAAAGRRAARVLAGLRDALKDCGRMHCGPVTVLAPVRALVSARRSVLWQQALRRCRDEFIHRLVDWKEMNPQAVFSWNLTIFSV